MSIQIVNRRATPRVPSAVLRHMLQQILATLGCPEAEVGLTCVDDAAMAELNGQWRGKPRTTDVLSFTQLDGLHLTPTGPLVLGDIVVSVPCAARQALQRGHSLEAEMARLLVHGTLHLLGHDHVHGGRQAGRMRRLERVLLTALGYDIDL